MSVDTLKVLEAIQSGLSPVCATCVHFWESKDKNMPGCSEDCGGPIAGKDFPKYSGPMTRLDKFCFACTAEAGFAVKSPDARPVGVCRSHLRLLDALRVSNSNSNFILELHSPKGIITPIKGRYTNKSLLEVMADTEAEWASNG